MEQKKRQQGLAQLDFAHGKVNTKSINGHMKDRYIHLNVIQIKSTKTNLMTVAANDGERRKVYYYITTNASLFHVYHGRLELMLQGDISTIDRKSKNVHNDKITCIEFG